MDQHVYPAEGTFEEHAAGPTRWTIPPLMEELKDKVGCNETVLGMGVQR
jgi:hypothetical protein